MASAEVETQRVDTSTPDTGTTRSERRFRPEVQALRALAVLLVLVYHISPPTLPGGYVGVDVFFVISGFLITGHLWREASTTGGVSLRRFWAARARRILPASLAATSGIVVLALLLLPLTKLEEWGRHALASVLYVENWVLASDSVDYQASDNAPTAFQHFWSLGVEEQFYLFWPMLVVAAVVLWRAGARRGTRSPDPAVLRGLLLVIFGLVIAVSFWSSFTRVNDGDPSAYYSTLTRTWQLAVGGFLALAWQDTQRAPRLRTVLAVGGFAAIIGAACLFDESTPFPGSAALLPTLGACAVIAAGRTQGPGSVRRVAENWTVQRIGDIPYWRSVGHFPGGVFCGSRADGRHPTLPEAVALAAASFALAIASYVLVELPVRRGTFFRHDWRMLISAVATMALVAGLTTMLPLRMSWTSESWESRAQAVEQDLDSHGAAGSDPDKRDPFVRDHAEIAPSPLRAKKDKPVEASECMVDTGAMETEVCTFGPPSDEAEATIAVLGDSHAAMFIEPILAVAEERDWHVETHMHAGCQYSTELRKTKDSYQDACRNSNEITREKLLEDPPDGVITVGREGYDFEDTDTGHTPGAAGRAELWNELTDAGSEVLVVRDGPAAREDVVDCVGEHYGEPTGCALTREEAYAGRDAMAEALDLAPDVTSIDLKEQFCTTSHCAAVINNVLVFRDDNHITDTFARTLIPAFEQELEGWPRSA